MKGYLISVEGSDGSGKSTQLQNIIAYLQQKGVDLVVTREPGEQQCPKPSEHCC